MDDTTREAMQIMEEINSPIETVMMEMMDRGYILHGSGSKFSLTKVPTEADQRAEINPEDALPTILGGFPSRAHALKWYRDHKDDAVLSGKPAKWYVHMAYNNGLGPKFKELENVFARTYDEAMAQATTQAEAWVSATVGRKKWGYDQVKVRPAPIQD